MIYVAPLAWTARSLALGLHSNASPDAGGASARLGPASAVGSLAFVLTQATRPNLRGIGLPSAIVERQSFPSPSQVMWAFIVGPSSELEQALVTIFVFVILCAILV